MTEFIRISIKISTSNMLLDATFIVRMIPRQLNRHICITLVSTIANNSSADLQA